MFNNIHTIISISRKKKIFVIWIVDFVIALLCWIIFGPALSVLVANNFKINLADILLLNHLNFIIPFLLVKYTHIYSAKAAQAVIRKQQCKTAKKVVSKIKSAAPEDAVRESSIFPITSTSATNRARISPNPREQ